ncbi:MAG TPA: type II secretion system protein, partial [Pirellulales bacterium]|nr:type II secretion system protein [Pirellulales bacterium]
MHVPFSLGEKVAAQPPDEGGEPAFHGGQRIAEILGQACLKFECGNFALTRSPRRRPPSPQGRGARRRAFTLIEMLVVLAILAALTLVAVQSLVP